ncbi:hypothetical protein GCM10022600_27560 [Qipengyuania pelagi]
MHRYLARQRRMGRSYSMTITGASKEASRFHSQKPVILMPTDRSLDHNRTDAAGARRPY